MPFWIVLRAFSEINDLAVVTAAFLHKTVTFQRMTITFLPVWSATHIDKNVWAQSFKKHVCTYSTILYFLKSYETVNWNIAHLYQLKRTHFLLESEKM